MVTDQQVLSERWKVRHNRHQRQYERNRWRSGPLPSEKKKRSWRTRPDAFSEVWEEIVPLLRRDAREQVAGQCCLSGWTSVTRAGSTHRPAHIAEADKGLACAERA